MDLNETNTFIDPEYPAYTKNIFTLKSIEHSNYIIVHNNNTFSSHRFSRLGFPREQLLRTIKANKQTIKALIFNEIVSPCDYDIPLYVKDIYFLQPARDLGRTSYPMFGMFQQDKQQTYHVFFPFSLQERINKFRSYLPPNVKLIPGLIGWYGTVHQKFVNNTQAYIELNNVTKEKYKKLQSFDSILWTGRIHSKRKETIDKLQLISQNKIKMCEDFDINKTPYIDKLIKEECFCVLSLDGYADTCIRDTELALAKTFSVKHTECSEAYITLKDSIYTFNDITFNAQIKRIKNDIICNNFERVEASHLFMSVLLRSGPVRPLELKDSFCILPIHELCLHAIGINIHDIILSDKFLSIIKNKDDESFYKELETFLSMYIKMKV